MQKALIVATIDMNTLEELNNYLAEGWKIASNAPMGVGGQSAGACSLIIIEKE